MASGSPRRRNTRGYDRSAAGITALKDELRRRIEALNSLAAEEERCHAATIAWMSDVERSEPPDQVGETPAPPGDGGVFTYETFTGIVESLEKQETSGRRQHRRGVDDGTTLSMHDLAKSSEFESLVEAVALYKRSCFGNDNIHFDAAAVREMILHHPDNPTVLHAVIKKHNDETTGDTKGKSPVLDIEDDYEDEINRKLMLCRFYGLETTHGANARQPPAAGRRSGPTTNNTNGSSHQPQKRTSGGGQSKATHRTTTGTNTTEKPIKMRNRSEFNDLEQWTLEHIEKPYPSQQDKAVLASKLGMSVHQVQHWFSNMRKRKYFPVCEKRRPPRDDFEVILFQVYQETHRCGPDDDVDNDDDDTNSARSTVGTKRNIDDSS